MLAAAECAMQEHVPFVIQQGLAVVAYIHQNGRFTGLFQTLDNLVNKVVGEADGIVVLVNKYRFKVLIHRHVLGSQSRKTFCLGIHMAEHLNDIDTLHVRCIVLKIIRIALAVLEVTT